MLDESSFFNRTVRGLRKAWSEISNTLLKRDEFSFAPDLSDADISKLRELIDRTLEAPAGEVSARALAAQIGESYIDLDPTGREKFLRLIASDYDVDTEALDNLIRDYVAGRDHQEAVSFRNTLRHLLVPPRVRLLTLFNSLPEGFKFLVDMRAELLAMGARKDPQLSLVESDLKELLGNWFDIGFLKLRHITWESPASILEKLIEYEAVHEISSWDDLKHRLAPDRRLYGFFHPNMPGEPLIFVQVALVKGIADNIQTLLDTSTASIEVKTADTAIFYSISNAQQGLAGISFGNFLIKRVVADLATTLPGISRFSTLSPVPGFMTWLKAQPVYGSKYELEAALQEEISRVAADQGVEPTFEALLGINGWNEIEAVTEFMRNPLTALCATYLTSHKVENGRVLDAVEHFHLSNGATLFQLNWFADSSAKGLEQSAGFMVNYLYDPDSIDGNTQQYSEQGSVTMSPEVRDLLGN
jgi:malonyl-CoA decarboxylase